MMRPAVLAPVAAGGSVTVGFVVSGTGTDTLLIRAVGEHPMVPGRHPD